MKTVIDIFTSKNFILSIVLVVIALVIFFIINKLQKFLKEKNKERTGGEGKTDTIISVGFSVFKYLVIFVTIMAILQVNGINVSSLVTSIGLVSAVVVYALQDVFKDIMAGMHIVNDKYFAVGDYIQYNGDEGVVISLNLHATVFKSVNDGGIYTVSNRNFTQVKKSPEYQFFDLPLSYEEDFRKVLGVLSASAEKAKTDPSIKNCVFKGAQHFADSAILYRFVVYSHPAERPDARRALIRVLMEDLDKAGITVPYNKLDVNLLKD